MIFVDSNAWIARALPKEPHNRLATEWMLHNPQALVTSDDVVDESLTVLLAKGEARVCIKRGHNVRRNFLKQWLLESACQFGAGCEMLGVWDREDMSLTKMNVKCS